MKMRIQLEHYNSSRCAYWVISLNAERAINGDRTLFCSIPLCLPILSIFQLKFKKKKTLAETPTHICKKKIKIAIVRFRDHHSACFGPVDKLKNKEFISELRSSRASLQIKKYKGLSNRSNL